jgi:two-component system, OmpR family, sensor histidine kinase BaeS
MKRTSLLWKLIAAFLLVALITGGLVAVFIRLTSADRLTHLIIDQQRSELVGTLSEYYSQNGSWNGIQTVWVQLRAHPPTPGQNANQGNNGDRVIRFDRRGLFGLVDLNNIVLISSNTDYPAGSTMPAELVRKGIPVLVSGKTVGTITVASSSPRFNPEENLFLQNTTEALVYALLGAIGISLVIGFLLARTLIHPLQDLTAAAQKMASGQLEQQVKVKSRDEIGQLSQAFNWMSREVARSNQLRKQMTADIAHDLRTPLTVIAGYIESMRDGVLQPTEARLSLIYHEIEGLQDLVGDLRMLSQVDAGELPLHPQIVAPASLLQHAAATFEHRASQQGVEITVDIPQPVADIRVDEGRMMQVFGNLLSNSLRYTPAEGKIVLSARQQDGHVRLSVSDTGQGIEESDLPFIFDRFHRADRSRHTDTGESGLGLAIVKALVEAHGGSVQAQSKLGQGTTIQIDLPAA